MTEKFSLFEFYLKSITGNTLAWQEGTMSTTDASMQLQ
jgi:hypothetical protein